MNRKINKLLEAVRAELNEAHSTPYPVKVKNPKVTGTFEVYSDASGAPAVLKYGNIAFSFDFLGEIKRNRLGRGSGREPRKLQQTAINVLTAAYQELLQRHTDAAWMQANREMYAS